MIAWRLTTDFDKQKHLFFEKIKTNYVIVAYICSCGYIDFVIKYSKQYVEYVCSRCENTKFYDANIAWKHGNFLYQYKDLDFTFEYDIENYTNGISSRYITKIPKTIDFLNSKVIFGKKSVCNLKLTIDGELKQSYALRLDEKKLSKLKKNLILYINKNKCLDIPYPKDKDLTLKMVSFFLKNKHLKDFDFYHWNDIDILEGQDIDINDALKIISNNHKAKSVRKTIYQNYIRQLKNSNSFDSKFIEAFTKTIRDINILVKLLSLELIYSKYSSVDSKYLEEMIVFLKKHYTEKQLLQFFSSKEFDSNKYLFRDTVHEFYFNKDLLHNKFKKVPCKVASLHDEFVRCSKEQRYEYMMYQKLNYTEEENQACIQLNNNKVRLPKTGQELYEWADALHNCMAGYFDDIKDKESIIYGFFQDNVLSFAVEIYHNTIIQASEKYNAKLSIENKNTLDKWFVQYCKIFSQ
jgi:hypothetical protein